MPKVRIIYNQYLDEQGVCYKIGGVETYIKNLITIFSENNFNVVVYQWGEHGFSIKKENVEIIGISKPKIHCRSLRKIVKAVKSEIDMENDIVIFAADFQIVRNNFRHVIAIQHGVAWDIPKESGSDLINIITILKGSARAFIKYFQYKNCSHIICVDYNFLNWYRSQISCISNQIDVIPNFAHILPFQSRESTENPVSIIFARRFVRYRGTRLFAGAIENLLRRDLNISVVFYGEGPDDEWLRAKFNKNNRVSFGHFEPQDSVKEHQRYDIAIIPTCGSEGTSLSLLEAMAAGCAIIATNIGGLTNIIINGYNGLLIPPDEKALEYAIEKLVTDEELRRTIAKRGYETVRYAFSYNRWRNEWNKVITTIQNEK